CRHCMFLADGCSFGDVCSCNEQTSPRLKRLALQNLRYRGRRLLIGRETDGGWHALRLCEGRGLAITPVVDSGRAAGTRFLTRTFRNNLELAPILRCNFS